jgi:hypothetical protein
MVEGFSTFSKISFDFFQSPQTLTRTTSSVSTPPSFFGAPHVRRVSAINLSRLKRELGKALGIADWA